MKSENNLKSELAKAVSISMAKPKLSKRTVFSLLKEMSLSEVRHVPLTGTVLGIRPLIQNARNFYTWNHSSETKSRIVQ